MKNNNRKKNKLLKKPELVAPAGDWAGLVTAVDSGADSVYFGVKGLNMRNLAGNFDALELKKIMGFLAKRKKQGYLALNVIIMEHELKKVESILIKAKQAQVNGIILWDLAVMSAAKKLNLPIHLSTQASVSNSAALESFVRLGAKRVVLARECPLFDIRKIIRIKKEKKINCRIEAFIHGAMCISISGRCFLSSYSSGKSANRGECLQYCRREFSIKDLDEEGDYILGKEYALSAKDLCSIDFIDQLIEAGIDAFKIEGRRRAPEYVKVVTAVYRRAIDAYFEGELTSSLKTMLKGQLQRVFNRGFSNGFYFGVPQNASSDKLESTYEKVFLGEVVKFFKKISVAEIRLQNRPLRKGQEILFIGKSTPASFAVAQELQQKHEFVSSIKKGELAGIKLPFIVKPKDKVFLWRKKQPE
ncbi:MAG: U32 family peptidase [Candidatus Omnitrophica bacterium]|nr:U32 family peptidase [Candidatus Omnitrophota bacterium]